MDENPLPLVTNNFLSTTLTFVGYHPTGINPLLLLRPGLETSNTVTQLLSALAIYNVFSLLLKVSPFVVEPFGASGYNAAFNVSITFFPAISITETELSFELATKRYFPFFVRQISFGLSPTIISLTIFFLSVSKTYNLSQPQQLIYNSFLLGDKTQA